MHIPLMYHYTAAINVSVVKSSICQYTDMFSCFQLIWQRQLFPRKHFPSNLCPQGPVTAQVHLHVILWLFTYTANDDYDSIK